MKLSFRLKGAKLAGEPREYNPRLVVWSTDRSTMEEAQVGMAAAIVELDDDHRGLRHIRIGDMLPSQASPEADLCVALYASTRETGYSDELMSPDKANTIRAGQVNIHWLGLMRHFSITGAEKIKVRAPIRSLAAYEGVLYHNSFEVDDAADKEEALVQISAKADSASTRGMLEVLIEPETPGSLEKIRQIGGSHATRRFMELNAASDANYSAGIDRYMKTYYEMFPRDGSGKLLYPPASGGKSVEFQPDTPNMNRFHLPLWSTGSDRLPFAEWWLVTLSQEHKSDGSTERFFAHLGEAGLARSQASRQEVIDTVQEAFGPDTSASKRRLYSQTGTKERSRLLRAIETTYYTCTALALSFRYTSDGRYVAMDDSGHRMVEIKRVQVEDPQQDIASGSSKSGDCEDLEKTIAICTHLLSRGLGGDNSEDWSDPLLSNMRRITKHYITLHTFGSVKGAKLSDAKSEQHIESFFPAPIESSGALAFGPEIPGEPRTPEERSMATLNARFYWWGKFQELRPWHARMWEAFASNNRKLFKEIYSLMPMSDSDRFWRDTVLWADHYISIRIHLVIERIEKERDIQVIFGNDDDKIRVIDKNKFPSDTTYTQGEFEWYYNNGRRLEQTGASSRDSLVGVEGFGAGIWSGEYERYPHFYKMAHLFPIANALMSWYERYIYAQGKVTPGEELYIDIDEGYGLQEVEVTDDWLLLHFKRLIRDIKLHGDPDEEPERVTILSQFQAPSVASSQHMDLYSSGADPETASVGLTKETVVFIEQNASVEELRQNLTPEVKREARNRPRAFWRKVMMTYYDQWNDRFVRVFASLAGHDLDDDLQRHIATREQQFGAYEMWRNAAMWLEWFHLKIERENRALWTLWLDAPRPEQHRQLDDLFDERGASLIPTERRREARKVSKAFLDVIGLADHLWMALDARYVKHVYNHIVQGLGVLGVAPKPFRNERERSSLLPSERIHMNFPRQGLESSDHLFRHRSQKGNRSNDIMDMADEACANLTELTAAVAWVLRDIKALDKSPLSGGADSNRSFVKNMRGWMFIYNYAKMDYLVRRANQRYSLSMNLNSLNWVRVEANSEPMDRRTFLTRFYKAPDLARVRLSTEDRLRFYSRLRQTEPEGADILIALDRMLELRAASHDMQLQQSPLSEEGTMLLRNFASEVRDFDPYHDRAKNLTITVSGHRTPHATTSGDMVTGELSAADLFVMDDAAKLPTMDMWSSIRNNRYLAELEERHPLVFWSRILRFRAPLLYRRARFVLGKGALSRYGLPEEDDVAWRNMLPWAAFYLKEVFESNIEDLGLRARYEHVDLNVIFDKNDGTTLSYKDYADATPNNDSLFDIMKEGLFVNPYGYEEETYRRLLLINTVVKYLFDREQTRDRNAQEFRRAMTMLGTMILRNPTAPPSGMFIPKTAAAAAANSGDVITSKAHNPSALEDDTTLIDNRADHEANIGGHMFALFSPTIHIDTLYTRHAELMDTLCGQEGPHHSLSAHVNDVIATMVGPNATHAEHKAARRLWGSLPILIGEGTGPQELMMRPLGDYFGASNELLQRTADHIATTSLIRKWDAVQEKQIVKPLTGLGEASSSSSSSKKITANIYGFQMHLFSGSMEERDPSTGTVYQRRLSNFYRRLGHGCSYELHEIDSRFRHLFWVRPDNMRFGANLRHFLEIGDALPLPAPPSLSAPYLTSDAKRGLERRGRHVMPYRFIFDQLAEEDISSDRSVTQDQDSTPNKLFPYGIHSETRIGSEAPESVVFEVQRGTPLADVILEAAGDQGITKYSVEANAALYLSEPDENRLVSVSSHISALVGPHVVAREKLSPSAPLLLRLQCKRTVEFKLTEKNDE